MNNKVFDCNHDSSCNDKKKRFLFMNTTGLDFVLFLKHSYIYKKNLGGCYITI